jgi:hypothetical protein
MIIDAECRLRRAVGRIEFGQYAGQECSVRPD